VGGPEFVFMLTREDVTIPDARGTFGEIADTGVAHVGCKDVGLPVSELAALIDDVRAAECTAYLEVVAETEEATLRSAEIAAEVHPDYVIGGTVVEPIQRILTGTGIRFFPYIGHVIGHPCLLRGTIEEVAADAKRVGALGVDGINLLAYRYDGDVPALVKAVSNATRLPVLCAGSVSSLERVRELATLGVWGFTVGTAALEGAFVPNAPLADQVGAILQAAREGGDRR
jgi:4-hydroxythreonine-4-phosphate dehydrogenase